MDPDKVAQWKAFLKRSRLEDTAVDFSLVVGELRTFLTPLLFAAAHDEAYHKSWTDGGPWS